MDWTMFALMISSTSFSMAFLGSVFPTFFTKISWSVSLSSSWMTLLYSLVYYFMDCTEATLCRAFST